MPKHKKVAQAHRRKKVDWWVELLRNHLNLTKKEADTAINMLLQETVIHIANGGSFKIKNLGTIYTTKKNPRLYTMPDGKQYKNKNSMRIKFVPSGNLTKIVNQIHKSMNKFGEFKNINEKNRDVPGVPGSRYKDE